MSLAWQAAGASHVGRVRRQNEDALHVDARRGVFLVADGMGGHAAGDVASRTAIRTVDELVSAAKGGVDPAERVEQLVEAARRANEAILSDAERVPERAGMGTTLTVFATLPGVATRAVVHVGDSRAYLLRDGTLTQLTTDHTWVQRQVELGKLSPRRARVHPYSSVLTNALGVPETDRIDTVVGDARPGDLYLLCTDGLTTVLEDDTIQSILSEDHDLAGWARELVDAANQAGGPDNVTVVLIRAESDA